ncbi:low-density lipoprotein receptor-related protein 1B-like [Bolinopsis microptera]|uniref:low-density lipoprotein receptor-related protein 1B-like n=1 Tax=Bolinopsis microptera TaxID=2820187 RepID=UPI00307B013B
MYGWLIHDVNPLQLGGGPSDPTDISCREEQFTCTDRKRCLENSFVCDGEVQCDDGSDESDCEDPTDISCREEQFTCADRKRCLENSFVCDGEVQCDDGSDESDCEDPTDISCREEQFTCADRKRCLENSFVCDGEVQCDDGSDESDCEDPTDISCREEQFTCADRKRCLENSFVCDGEVQCDDGSDESDCEDPTDISCREEQFTCADRKRCLENSFVCDGEVQCDDGSDESDCEDPTDISCREEQFTCADRKRCLENSFVCDGEVQCDDGSDESDCEDPTDISCREEQFTCADRKRCLENSFVCDGEVQCDDGSDESDCEDPTDISCREEQFTCADRKRCLENSFVCDGEVQCDDGSDESDCEETCDPEEAEVVIPGGNFVSEREEGENYKDGDKVNYICNDNFAMEGNPFVVCSAGGKFNSQPPKCTAVNTDCDEFTVENGKLSIKHPYLTNDEVQVTCGTDYFPDGTNPIRCVENGWENDAPVCVTDDGSQCVPLSPPKNGDFTCSGLDEGKAVAGSKCSVFCKESFLAVEDAVEETTCEADSFTWTHQNSDNPLAELQPCMAMIAPEEKMLSNEVTIKSIYCQTEDEKKAITETLKKFLQETLLISCLGSGVCQVNDVLCTPGNDDIVLNFDVVQTSDMLNLEVLEEAKTKITNSVTSETFTLTIDDGKRRRRRSVTMSADKDFLKVEEKVTCGPGEVTKDGVCVKCPAGYKTVDGACVACEIATYNAAEGASDCIACDGDKTTYGIGSTKVDQCFDLCTVPEIPGGSLNKEVGFKVEPDYILVLTCDDGETWRSSVWALVIVIITLR